MSQLEWPTILHDHGLGFPLKFIWDERAKTLTTYSNFWKQFYRKFPQCRKDGVTARTFEPGERVEVDYAGDPIEWYDLKTGEVHKAYVFGPAPFRWTVYCLSFLTSSSSKLCYRRGLPPKAVEALV
jgi:hypothetical protein